MIVATWSWNRSNACNECTHRNDTYVLLAYELCVKTRVDRRWAMARQTSLGWQSMTDARTHVGTTHNSLSTRENIQVWVIVCGYVRAEVIPRTFLLFWRYPPIHMIITGPRNVILSAFIKCTTSDPFRLSVLFQEFLSHSKSTTNTKPLLL